MIDKQKNQRGKHETKSRFVVEPYFYVQAETVTVTVTTTVSCEALPSSHKSLLAQPSFGASPPSNTTKAALSAMSPKMAKPMSESSWMPP